MYISTENYSILFRSTILCYNFIRSTIDAFTIILKRLLYYQYIICSIVLFHAIIFQNGQIPGLVINYQCYKTTVCIKSCFVYPLILLLGEK